MLIRAQVGPSHLGSLKELKITSKPIRQRRKETAFLFFFSFSQCPLKTNLLQGGVRGSPESRQRVLGNAELSVQLLPASPALPWGSGCRHVPPGCTLHAAPRACGQQLELLLPSGVPRCEGSAEPGQGSSSMAPSAGSSFPKKKSCQRKNQNTTTSTSRFESLRTTQAGPGGGGGCSGQAGAVFPCG